MIWLVADEATLACDLVGETDDGAKEAMVRIRHDNGNILFQHPEHRRRWTGPELDNAIVKAIEKQPDRIPPKRPHVEAIDAHVAP